MAIDNAAMSNSTEQMEQNLEAMLALLSNAASDLHEVADAFQSVQVLLEQKKLDVESAMQGLTGAFDEGISTTASVMSGLEQHYSELEDLLEKQVGNLEQSAAAAESAHETFDQQLTAAEADLSAASDALTAAHGAALQETEDLDSALEEVNSDLTQAFNNVETSLSSATQSSEIMGQNITQQFTDVSGIVKGDFSNDLGSAFETTSQEIAGDILSAITDGIKALDDLVQKSLQTLGSSAEAFANRLIEQLSEAFTNLISLLEDVLLEALKTCFEHMIAEVIKVVGEEVAANVLSFTVGSQITAALTAPLPILPALAAIQQVLSSINAMLDLFG